MDNWTLKEERRKENECPKCHSKLKAIIENKLVCVGIGCEHIYRNDVIEYRKEDSKFAELKNEWQ